MNKVAAVVVVYNPDLKLVQENISTYIDQVDRVYVVDNSDDSTVFEPTNDKVSYINLAQNRGIAYALNAGFKHAQEDGFEWVITFDQDSKAPNSLVDKLMAIAIENRANNAAIISPIVSLFDGHCPASNNNNAIEKRGVLTSGSLSKVEAWNKVGGFCQEMFIDWVDIEFCINLRQNGYKIFEAQNVILNHQLGETTEIKICGKHIAFITNHNYIRRYYATRNALFIFRKYNTVFEKEAKHIKASILKSTLKIILLENDKRRKMKAINIAIKDAKNNLYGKVDPNRL